MERTDDDAPVRVPTVEREARREVLQTKLGKGLKMEGPLDPSHALFDRVHDLYGENLVRYIAPQFCTMRDQETLGITKTKEWKDYVADVSSVRLLEKAFQRRAMAFDMADLCSYEVFMEVMNELVGLVGVAPPPGYKPVSLDQVWAADELIFIELGKACRRGIKPLANGERPIETSIREVFKSQKVQLRLTPLHGGNTAPGRGDGANISRGAKREPDEPPESRKLSRSQKFKKLAKGYPRKTRKSCSGRRT